MNRRLYRSVVDRKIGGVAAGTATFFGIDPSIARVIWVLLAIFTSGAFLIVYLVMWAVVPDEPWTPELEAQVAAGGASSAGQRPPGTPGATAGTGPDGRVILGAILILIGAWFLARQFLPRFDFDLVWPIGLVVIGILILLAALRRG